MTAEAVSPGRFNDMSNRINEMLQKGVPERELAANALCKSGELLKLITDNMSDMIRLTDLQGNTLYASPSHLTLAQMVQERTFELQATNAQLSHEIAERKQNEEKYRTLFESSRDAIMTLEPPSWHFTTGNPAAIELFETGDEAAFIALGPWARERASGSPSATASSRIMGAQFYYQTSPATATGPEDGVHRNPCRRYRIFLWTQREANANRAC